MGECVAKRLTDTKKWKMAWYRKLGSQKRDLWNYLHDNCDFDGLFELDLERTSYELGFPVTLETIREVLKGNLIFASDDRLFLPAFVEFQYGELSESVRCHASVIRNLKKEGVWEQYAKGFQTLKDKDKDKDKYKDKDKDKNKEGGVGETKPLTAITGNGGKADPKFSLSQENLERAYGAWLDTLVVLKMGRANLLDREQRSIAQAIQRDGANAVVMALTGPRHAPKDDFDSTWFSDVSRVLSPKNFLRFVYLGVQAGHKQRDTA